MKKMTGPGRSYL